MRTMRAVNIAEENNVAMEIVIRVYQGLPGPMWTSQVFCNNAWWNRRNISLLEYIGGWLKVIIIYYNY